MWFDLLVQAQTRPYRTPAENARLEQGRGARWTGRTRSRAPLLIWLVADA